MHAEISGVILAALSALFLATELLIVRKATVTGKPLDAVIVTLFINVIIFLPISIIKYDLISYLNLKTLTAFALAGLFGSFLARVCVYSGTEKVGASKTSPILKGDLLVASGVSIAFLGETITPGHLIGILFLFLGIFLVSREIETKNEKEDWKPTLGLLFPLAGMFFSGLARPLAKLGLRTGTPVEIGLTVKFSAALIVMFLYSVGRGNSPFQPFRVKERNLYIAVGLVTTVGMWLFYLALRISRVVVVMPFWSLTPVIVMILSYLLLRRLEKITKPLVIGTILVVIGTSLTGIYM